MFHAEFHPVDLFNSPSAAATRPWRSLRPSTECPTIWPLALFPTTRCSSTRRRWNSSESLGWYIYIYIYIYIMLILETPRNRLILKKDWPYYALIIFDVMNTSKAHAWRNCVNGTVSGCTQTLVPRWSSTCQVKHVTHRSLDTPSPAPLMLEPPSQADVLPVVFVLHWWY